MAAQKSAITIGLPCGGPRPLVRGGLRPDIRRWSASLVARREMLLATSALALGLALSVAGPDHALANCDLTSAPNTVTCSVSFNTFDGAVTNGIGQAWDRWLIFDAGGDVNAIVQSGVTLGGFGMRLVGAEGGAAVTMTHSGIINHTSTGVYGSPGALRVEAAGGLLTYSGNGSITTNQAATSALMLVNTTGNIVIGGAGTPVNPNYTATTGAALLAQTSSGNISAFLDGGILTGGRGIVMSNSNSGNISLTLTGGTTVTALGGYGIDAGTPDGAIDITLDAAVSATGDGVRAGIGLGAITITNKASITSSGVFAGVTVIGGTDNLVVNAAGATISGGTGVVSVATGTFTTVDNAGTITGTGGTAVSFTGGTGNVLFMNGAGAVLVGAAVGNGADTVRLGGTGANTFDVSQIGAGFTSLAKTDASTWTLTGTATTTAATTVGGGALLVNGSTASSATTVNAGGTLGGGGTVGTTTINGGTLSPGNSIGTLTVQGNLTFASAASYLVEVSPSDADRTSVTGAATLAGTVKATFLPGTYLQRTYTILSAAGGRSGTFDTLSTTDLPSGFTADLSYTGTDAVLNLTAILGAGPGTLPVGGLNPNQQGVAGALNGYFNNGGALPPAFVTVFGQTGTQLGTTLSQISGESNTAAPETTFRANEYFVGLLLGGRSGEGGSLGAAPLGFAAEPKGALPDEVALAYAKAMPGSVPAKAPPRAYEPRWSVWGSAYGGYATVDGNAGSSSTSSRAGGFAVGADYRAWPDTVVGFALAGGGTSWSSANGGSGRSDTFQAGLYGSHKFGAAYVSAALAYAWHDTTTTRTVSVGPETLEGRFRPHVLSARAEAGYRFEFGAYGLTPYAAAQVQSFHAPAYTETATSGAGTFALTYGSQTQTTPRTELGLWADHLQRVTADTDLVLRGRVAWAHDFQDGGRLSPSFVSLPGAAFTVDGASASPNLALLSAVSELRMRNGITLSARFDGEFGGRSESYAGTGTLRYSW